MRLLAIGINHSTANVELREQLAFAPEVMQTALQSLLACLSQANNSQALEFAAEAVIVSTCNRTELIVSTNHNAEAVITWLAEYKLLAVEEFNEHIYIHEGQAALRHLIRVAGGLDSMILGEPQIFGQMKSSYAVSRQVSAIGIELEPIFQHVFAVAKKVRSDTAIGENPVSVAFAAVTLAQRIFADLSSVAVLLVGAGDTIELVAQHLINSGAKNVVVANRTLDRAQTLADRLNAKAILLSDVPDSLGDFDIVISSTASQLPVLGKGAVEEALKLRKRRPIFMVDIAVPRDIEPQVADLPDVYLYTVDDLRDIIDHNVRLRVAEANKAADIIDVGVQEFFTWQRSREATDLVVSYRNNIQSLRDEELERALQLIQSGKSSEEALTSLARALTQKIMHQPTVEMRNAAGLNNKALLESAKILFGLEKIISEPDHSSSSSSSNGSGSNKSRSDNTQND